MDLNQHVVRFNLKMINQNEPADTLCDEVEDGNISIAFNVIFVLVA